MTVYRVISLTTALALAAAPLAAAQSVLINQPRVVSMPYDNGMELFEWNGRVDREVQIVMRGGNVWTNEVGATERPRARTRTFSRMPNGNGRVYVEVLDGRGDVDVIQQPNRGNDYTTIVRVRDGRGGSDNYRLAAYWDGRDVYGGESRDRDVYRDRNRDGVDDRNERGDRGDRGDRGERGVYGGGVNGNYPNTYPNNGRYNQEVLHWSGNVDGELEIRLQNGRVEYRTLSGSQPTSVRANPGNMNVRNAANLSVVQNSGRGSVWVAQQPSAWNGYTTVIRVRDPQSGSAYYDFSLIPQ